MPGVPGQSGEDAAALRYLQGHGAICEPIEPGEWSQTPDGANLKELARIAVFEPPHCVPRVPSSVGDRNAQSRRRTEDAGKKAQEQTGRVEVQHAHSLGARAQEHADAPRSRSCTFT